MLLTRGSCVASRQASAERRSRLALSAQRAMPVARCAARRCRCSSGWMTASCSSPPTLRTLWPLRRALSQAQVRCARTHASLGGAQPAAAAPALALLRLTRPPLACPAPRCQPWTCWTSTAPPTLTCSMAASAPTQACSAGGGRDQGVAVGAASQPRCPALCCCLQASSRASGTPPACRWS